MKPEENSRLEVEKDIHTDKTIIIGFTGPIGSGCTELSKFLEGQNNEFGDFLFKSGYINKVMSSEINHNILDNVIKTLYRDKAAKEKEIEDLKNKISSSGMKPLSTLFKIKNDNVKVLNNQLKLNLEKRNYLHSLEYMLSSDYYVNRLRISCSSLIVFELARNIDNEIQIKDDKNDKKSRIEEFKQDIKESFNGLNNTTDGDDIPGKFNRIYRGIESYYNHKNEATDISIKQVNECFKHVAEIKRRLINNPTYGELMQDFGDNLRSTGDPYHYMDTEWINEEANKTKFLQNNFEIARIIDRLIHYYTNKSDQTKYFYLIDSLRSPMSIKYLRNRYPKLYLISLFAPYEEREKRVINPENETEKERFETQDKRDMGKNLKGNEKVFKQNVRESVLVSDIAINNEDKFQKDLSGKLSRHESTIFHKLMRYIALIVDKGCTKPTIEETFMNMAYTMAMKSNCISRKVGAVIAGKEGYLVGAGWNDVGEGQISCGLRYIKDLRLPEYENIVKSMNIKSNRQHDAEHFITLFRNKWEDVDTEKFENLCFCLKDMMSEFELNQKVDDIYDSEIKNKTREEISKFIDNIQIESPIKEQLNSDFKSQIDQIVDHIKKKLKVKRLEFCKALHAEENAIIQSAKIGGMGIQDGTIYTTTFPCELCSKKIQQSGIKEVVYVEPYPKSISKELFLKEGIKKVKVTQFEGVTAYGYMKLFKSFLDHKERNEMEFSGLHQNI